MRKRLAPFLDLLDARYLPLLFLAAPQAYTVYAWLVADGAPEMIARLGAVGFEFVYVGAIAWAERGAGWQAARPPAVTALLFSVAVAVAHYGPTRGALAVLHAGFPIVGYAYMVMMHAPKMAPATSKPAREDTASEHIAHERKQTPAIPLAPSRDYTCKHCGMGGLTAAENMTHGRVRKATGLCPAQRVAAAD